MSALGYVPGNHSGVWSSLSHRLFGSRKFSRTIEFRILRNWLPKQPSRILDVAAGSGELAVQIAMLGHEVVAVDIDAEGLEQLRDPRLPDIEFKVCDAGDLPFPDRSFDAIVCNSAIEHFPDDTQAVSEMNRVLRKGGCALITTDSFPESQSMSAGLIPRRFRKPEFRNSTDLHADMRAYHEEKHHVVNYYDINTITDKFNRYHFEIGDWRYYMNGPISRAVYESHILLDSLEFYNARSRRMFPMFYPFTFPLWRKSMGHGLAIKAIRR